MKKMILILLCTFITGAFANSNHNIERVRTVMKSIVGITNQARDVRLVVYEVDGPICGSVEKSIAAKFQVKRHKKALDRSGNIVLKTEFETVKTYGVQKSLIEHLSLEELENEMMDIEVCVN